MNLCSTYIYYLSIILLYKIENIYNRERKKKEKKKIEKIEI